MCARVSVHASFCACVVSSTVHVVCLRLSACVRACALEEMERQLQTMNDGRWGPSDGPRLSYD